MKLLIPSIALVIFLAGCSKTSNINNVPTCITAIINENKNKPNWRIKSVDEYQYQGQLVYLFEPDYIIADQKIDVYMDDCTILCSLGGFAGISMCNGERFSDKAVFQRKVWER